MLNMVFSGSSAMKSSRITFAASAMNVSAVVGPWYAGKALPSAVHVLPSSS